MRKETVSALVELAIVITAASLLGHKFGWQVGWASGLVGFLIWRRM